jgi:hypothetical protein
VTVPSLGAYVAVNIRPVTEVSFFKGESAHNMYLLSHLRTKIDPVSETASFSLFNIGQWTKSKNPINLTGIHHQKPVESI